jgi:hypothetical protein
MGQESEVNNAPKHLESPEEPEQNLSLLRKTSTELGLAHGRAPAYQAQGP